MILKFPSLCLLGALVHVATGFGDSSSILSDNLLGTIFNSPVMFNTINDEAKAALGRMEKTLSLMQPTNYFITKVLPSLTPQTPPSDGVEGRFIKVVSKGSKTTSLQVLCDILSTALEDYNDLIFRLSEEFDDFVQQRVTQANIAPDFEDQVLAAIADTNAAAMDAVGDLSTALNGLTMDLGVSLRRRG